MSFPRAYLLFHPDEIQGVQEAGKPKQKSKDQVNPEIHPQLALFQNDTQRGDEKSYDALYNFVIHRSFSFFGLDGWAETHYEYYITIVKTSQSWRLRKRRVFLKSFFIHEVHEEHEV